MDVVDTTHKVLDYANANRNKISKIIINAILLVIIFAIFGCFDFVNFTIDITLLANWKYWTKVFSKTLGGSIVFNIGINLLFDRTFFTEENYCRLGKKEYSFSDVYEKLLEVVEIW